MYVDIYYINTYLPINCVSCFSTTFRRNIILHSMVLKYITLH